MIVVNHTSDNSLKIAFNGENYLLERGQSVSFKSTETPVRLSVTPSDKNRVIVNLFFVLLNKYVDDESIINFLICDVDAVVENVENDAVIIVNDLKCRDDRGDYIYKSVNFHCTGCSIANVRYQLKEFSSEKAKALLFYIFFCSALPLLILLLGVFLYFKNTKIFFSVLAVFAFILVFFLFSLPAFKKAEKVRMHYNNEYADNVLHKEVE